VGGNQWFMGIYNITAEDISRAAGKGESYSLRGYGLLRIDPACAEELLFSVVTAIQLRGKAIASASIKEHYGLK